MRKIALIFALTGLLLASGQRPDFSIYGCAVMKPGESRTFPKGKNCIIFDNARDTIFWVKMTAIPYHTGDPQYDRLWNSQPRSLNYVGCTSYDYFNSLEGNKFEEGFDYTDFRVGETVWFLTVASREDDFCYITGGGAMKVETMVVEKQNDAGSGRDTTSREPAYVEVNKTYEGASAVDEDWFRVKLPKEKLIKFSITYKDGPSGPHRLVYGLGWGGPGKNYFTYCTANHKLVSSLAYDGSRAWYSAFFPRVGQTAYCYLKYRKKKPEDPDYVVIPLWVKPPAQYPPPDEAKKPKSAYRLPRYTFSFQVVEENTKH